MTINGLNQECQVCRIETSVVKVLEIFFPMFSHCISMMDTEIMLKHDTIKVLCFKLIINWLHDIVKPIKVGIRIDPCLGLE